MCSVICVLHKLVDKHIFSCLASLLLASLQPPIPPLAQATAVIFLKNNGIKGRSDLKARRDDVSELVFPGGQ